MIVGDPAVVEHRLPEINRREAKRGSVAQVFFKAGCEGFGRGEIGAGSGFRLRPTLRLPD